MVKQQEFKVCSQSGFCKRQRAFAQLRDASHPLNVHYAVISSSIHLEPENGSLKAKIIETNTNVAYTLLLTTLEHQTARLQLYEEQPVHSVYSGPSDVVIDNQFHSKAFNVIQGNQSMVVNFGISRILLEFDPFRLELYHRQTLVLKLNERNYLNYEFSRKPKEEQILQQESVDQQPPTKEIPKKLEHLIKDLEADMWTETFNGKTDSKPKGPSSIGLDVSFPGYEHVYGIPEHASDFSLKSTRGPFAEYSEPYRLYNLDVFEYILDSPMALYGSIPFMFSHKIDSSIGFFWMNSAEMWVDVEKSSQHEKGFKLTKLFKGKSEPSVSTHWMAESNIIDFYMFTGDKPADIVNSFTLLTGRPTMPQLFAIGYHQCRWNFNDEEDVQYVDSTSDKHQIPYDVLWLDIEHTNGKRYFTWDSVKFPNPIAMQNDLFSRGRKMVTIIDPHIKVDENYPVWKNAKDLDLFVKSSESLQFEGWCWPGNSQWLDYLNPVSRQFWASQFTLENYSGSTLSLYYWNDMNEPSVFTGPEITMPKDNLHFGQWEHRDVHNIYGMLQQRSTYEGHLLKTNNNDRPFVLSRAFFAGTQRYGAIWTGDNMAQWEHLKASVPMLLTIGMSGVTFSGADVGGFFGNPEAELVVRWYQIGAFQPFFRSHQHIDSKRREPWIFGEPYTTYIRDAIRARYILLPYLYTLFYESHVNGLPIMRPMLLEFPNDEKSFAMDDQFMLGSALVIKPVVSKEQTSVSIYLPKSDIWFDYAAFTWIASGIQTVYTPLDKIAVFLKGGSIVPRRQRIRRAGALTVHDPFTLLIALDANESASGSLYSDDGKTFDYQRGAFVFSSFKYEGNVLTGTASKTSTLSIDTFGQRVERIYILGLKKIPKSVQVLDKVLEFTSRSIGGGYYQITVKNPNVWIGKDWKLLIQ